MEFGMPMQHLQRWEVVKAQVEDEKEDFVSTSLWVLDEKQGI